VIVKKKILVVARRLLFDHWTMWGSDFLTKKDPVAFLWRNFEWIFRNSEFSIRRE